MSNNNNSNPYFLPPKNLEEVEQNTLSINKLRILKQNGINRLRQLGKRLPSNHNPTNKTLLRNQLLGRELQPGELSNPYLLSRKNLERVVHNTLSINELINLKEKGIERLHQLGKNLPSNHNPTNADPKTLLRTQLLGQDRQQEPQPAAAVAVQPGELQLGEPGEPGEPGELQKGGRRRTTRHKHRKHKRAHKSKRRYRR